MKIHYLLIALLAFVNLSRAEVSTEAEARLIDVIRKMEAEKTLRYLTEIYSPDGAPQNRVMEMNRTMELMIARGVHSVQLIEIFPGMRNRLGRPQLIDGQQYSLSGSPYKMLEVRYRDKIEGGSSGFTLVVCERDSKLILAELEPKDKKDE